MSDRASALYDGAVTHRRFRPRHHRLRYRLFDLLIDLDDLATLDRRLRLFAHNRFALFSLCDRDHGRGEDRPLRPQVEAMLREAGIDLAGGPIRLFCMPRVLGYVFNPLSVFFCHRPNGDLAAALLEVNNTFGERHFYLVRADEGSPAKVLRATSAKRFFVSPFLTMDMSYDFRIEAPAENARLAILGRDADGGPLIAAAFTGARRELSDRTLAVAFLSHPLLTLKVILAIHWEAAKLVAKGVRLRRKPPPPDLILTAARGVREEA
ncbi:MAG: DUF1365 domain-containing protein [Caulobacteraceae bacterium]